MAFSQAKADSTTFPPRMRASSGEEVFRWDERDVRKPGA
jgi:hypothetical protein